MSFLRVSVDEDLSREQMNIIEMDLRRQLNGLQLDAGATGTLLEVRSPRLANGRIVARIEAVPQSGVSVGSHTRLEILEKAHGLNSSLRSASGASHIGAHIVSEVRQELGQYVSTVSLNSPDDLPALRRAESQLKGLIGLPKDEIIADMVGRLRGRGWLGEWSRRHYGGIIAGTAIVHRSTPFILLAGDPGTGKSVLIHHISPIIARNLASQVLFVQLNARLRGTGIQGRAGTEVVNVFDAISNIADKHSIPTLVFLDEAEAVAGSRAAGDDSSGAQENVAVVDALIVALDKIFAHLEARLVFITATNLLGRIDAAVSRRATIYRFERPSSDQRRMILQHALGGSTDSVVLDAVNSALERDGYALTAADVLNQIVGRAIREAAHEDRPINPEQLLDLAQRAIATSPVGHAS